MKKDFLEGFKSEPKGSIILKTDGTFTCPTSPASTKVSAEGRGNYGTLSANPDYGMTGLMAMNTWDTSCYGEVRPGYIFLFPGTYDSPPPTYQGTVYLNCSVQQALTGSGGTLHGEMCAILGRPTTDFIGFSCNYPYNGAGNVGYNSGTCNPYWFNGSREIPADCNGTNWQAIVYDALDYWLPS